eukprot:gene11237-4057_t
MTDYYISESGKKNLGEYKYHNADASYITPFFQPFWNWIVNFLPMTMAPNLVTLVGFFGVLVHYFTTVFFAGPNLQGELVPSWVYYLNAFWLFYYMTMDAIDGKQARRTGSSSALGELFDHGCDALACMLQAITTIAATQLAGSWTGFFVYVIIHCTFYFAIWEQYYTGSMRFSAFSGPTEALLGAIAIQVAAGYLGAKFWTRKASYYLEDIAFAKNFSFLLDYEVNFIIGVSFILLALAGLFLNFYYIFTAQLTKEEYKLKGSAMRVSFPFFFLLVSWSVWVYCSNEHLLNTHVVLGWSLFGGLVGYIVSIQVLSRVIRMRTPTFHYILLPMGVFGAHSMVCYFLSIEPLISDFNALIFYWVYA